MPDALTLILVGIGGVFFGLAIAFFFALIAINRSEQENRRLRKQLALLGED